MRTTSRPARDAHAAAAEPGAPPANGLPSSGPAGDDCRPVFAAIKLLKEEIGVPSEVLVLDGISLWDFDYIDLGRVRMPSFTVPVTIKSLIFSEDPRRPHRHRHSHDHGHSHGQSHTHTHDHGHDHAHAHSHTHDHEHGHTHDHAHHPGGHHHHHDDRG